MRFETIKASAHLVWKMKMAGIRIRQDGGDIVLAGLPGGETISIHLIESPIPLYEIRHILNANGAKGYYTLFVLWCDLLLPGHGDLVAPHDWEQALLALYDERIYAFEVFGDDIFVFPVHFDRDGAYRSIRYGYTLQMKHLVCGVVETNGPYLHGMWRVVSFGAGAQQTQFHEEQPENGRFARAPDGMAACYAILEISLDAGPDDVKFAYRRLARRYHPDLNSDPDATARMQAINAAYERIIKQFEDSP